MLIEDFCISGFRPINHQKKSLVIHILFIIIILSLYGMLMPIDSSLLNNQLISQISLCPFSLVKTQFKADTGGTCPSISSHISPYWEITILLFR